MILIKDGRVVDPKRGIDDVLDLLIEDGKIKKIAISTYIITPYNVDFVGDNLMDELENNGVYL